MAVRVTCRIKEDPEEVTSRPKSKGTKGDETTDEDPATRSLLWGYGGVSVVPGGRYPILEALVRIYLRQDDIPDLLDLITEVLKKGIADQIYWQHLLTRLANLRPRPQEDATSRVNVLRQIIDQFPKLRGTRELAQLLAYVHWWAIDFVEQELSHWRGEQLALRNLATASSSLCWHYCTQTGNGQNMRWPRLKTTRLVRTRGRVRQRQRSIYGWRRPTGLCATALLLRLLPNAGQGEWSAVFDLFRIVDELTPEGNTVLLLEAIADNMDAAPHLNSGFIVDRLETLLPHEASLVARIADGLIRKWKEDLGDIRTGTATTAPKLIDVAVTLHRLGPNTREEGTRLFEQLLEIDAYLARQTLDEIDNRFRQERAVN